METISYANHVTAIEFVNNSDFVIGTGPFIEYFKRNKCISTTRLFDKNIRIHGISKINILQTIDTKFFLAFGSKYTAIFSIHSKSSLISIHCIIGPFGDWIKDCKILRDSSNGDLQICLLFAHNFTQVWALAFKCFECTHKDILRIKPPRPLAVTIHASDYIDLVSSGPATNQDLTLINHCQCQENCILYAGNIEGDSLDNLTIISGTVFNEIHIWKPSYASNELGSISYRLTGHEGVLFKIKSYFAEDGKRIIVSVSDDRTTRIWTESDDGYSEKVFYGHLGRVWDAFLILKNNILISCSEDGTLKTWNVKDAKCLKTTGGFLSDVWTISCNPQNDLIVAGGVGGEIRSSLLSTLLESEVVQQTIVPFLENGAIPCKRASLFFDGSFLSVTAYGGFYFTSATGVASIFIYNDSAGDYILADIFISVTLFSLVVAYNTVNGKLLIFSKNGFEIPMLAVSLDVPIFENPQLHVNYITETQSCIILIGNSALPKMVCRNSKSFTYELNVSNTDDINLKNHSSLTYPIPCMQVHKRYRAEHSITAMESIFVNNKIYLICGTSHGQIYTFIKENTEFKFLQCYEEVHGLETITDIKALSAVDGITLMTIGRDGNLNRYCVNFENDIIQLEHISCSKVSKGWLEKIVVHDSKVFICMILNKKIHILNYATNEIEMVIPFNACHRSWNVYRSNSQIQIGYVKNESMDIFTKTFSSNGLDGFYGNIRSIHGNGMIYHAKETRKMTILNFDDTEQSLMFTGGEDCILSLWKLNSESTKHVADLKKHSSAVTDICVVPSSFTSSSGNRKSHLVFSCGAKEEIHCWRVETLHSANDVGISNIYDVSSCPVVCEIRDTRVMSMSVVPYNKENRKNRNKIDTYCLYIIFAAYSDSHVRAWIFDERQQKFMIVGKEKFDENCLTCAKAVDESKLKFVTGTSGGKLLFWDILSTIDDFILRNESYFDGSLSPELEVMTCEHSGKFIRVQKNRERNLSKDGPYLVSQPHLSGINCIDVFETPERDIYVATGGDDGFIRLFLISPSRNSHHEHRKDFSHYSAVKGVKLVNIRSVVHLISVSVDQELNIWRVDREDGLVHVQNGMFDIADVADLYCKVCRKDNDDDDENGGLEIILSGMGYQRIKISKLQK